jgi:hypothetical protein
LLLFSLARKFPLPRPLLFLPSSGGRAVLPLRRSPRPVPLVLQHR